MFALLSDAYAIAMSSVVLHNLSAHFVWCKYFTMLAWPLFHERSATPTDAMLASWCEVLPHFFAPPGQKTVLGMFSTSTRLRSFATTSSYLLAILEIAGCHATTHLRTIAKVSPLQTYFTSLPRTALRITYPPGLLLHSKAFGVQSLWGSWTRCSFPATT